MLDYTQNAPSEYAKYAVGYVLSVLHTIFRLCNAVRNNMPTVPVGATQCSRPNTVGCVLSVLHVIFRPCRTEV